MSAATPTEEIVLRVPARAAYARIVRVGAAALALRQGMSFTEIDDLRLAVDEAMILLLDGTAADTDNGVVIDCVFRVDHGRFELEATRTSDALVADDAVERFDELASGLLDDYDIDAARAWLRLRKDHAED